MTEDTTDNIASFLGSPNSVKNGLSVDHLDISNIEHEEFESAKVRAIAKKVWERGIALEFICNCCKIVHKGDENPIRAMILSYAASRVLNTTGIHISMSGGAGTGKSHASNTAANHLPTGSVDKSRLSDKALLYHEIVARTVMLIDDQKLTEDMQELIKNSSTHFHEEATYRTVVRQKAVTLKLPKEMIYWVVKAELNGDDQILDRQLKFWTDDSLEQMDAIREAIIKQAITPEKPEDKMTAKICRAIWEFVPDVLVTMPFAYRMWWDDGMEARNVQLFMALIQASALMHLPARICNPDPKTGVLVVVADEEDYKIACNIMNPILGNKGGSQKSNMSKRAAMMLNDFFAKQPSGIYTFTQLRDELEWSAELVSQALHGRDDSSKEGLLSACPAIGITRETFPKAGGGVFDDNAVKWNRELYNRWSGAAGEFTLLTDEEHEQRLQFQKDKIRSIKEQQAKESEKIQE